jgi:hypothetical protein
MKLAQCGADMQRQHVLPHVRLQCSSAVERAIRVTLDRVGQAATFLQPPPKTFLHRVQLHVKLYSMHAPYDERSASDNSITTISTFELTTVEGLPTLLQGDRNLEPSSAEGAWHRCSVFSVHLSAGAMRL